MFHQKRVRGNGVAVKASAYDIGHVLVSYADAFTHLLLVQGGVKGHSKYCFLDMLQAMPLCIKKFAYFRGRDMSVLESNF